MNKTYRAVIGAFPVGMFPTLRDVHFASEPESCALWVAHDLLQQNKWNIAEVSSLPQALFRISIYSLG
jgi:hypothetical protein